MRCIVPSPFTAVAARRAHPSNARGGKNIRQRRTSSGGSTSRRIAISFPPFASFRGGNALFATRGADHTPAWYGIKVWPEASTPCRNGTFTRPSQLRMYIRRCRKANLGWRFRWGGCGGLGRARLAMGGSTRHPQFRGNPGGKHRDPQVCTGNLKPSNVLRATIGPRGPRSGRRRVGQHPSSACRAAPRKKNPGERREAPPRSR